jgi:hypothetical protein
LYVTATESELERLLPSPTTRPADRVSTAWAQGGYTDDLDAPGPSVARRDAYLTRLRSASQTPESFGVVVDALARSSLVCFERVPGHDGRPGRTAAHWCLPPLAELEPEVRDALRASRLRRFLPSDDPARRRGTRGALTVGGSSVHLDLDAAPVLVAPLGWQRSFEGPQPLRAPGSFRAVRGAVAEAVTGAVVAVRHGGQDALDRTSWDRDEQLSREPPGVWLAERDGGGWDIDPTASWALNVLADKARELLPPFVDERYELVMRLRPPSHWFTHDPIAVELSRRDTHPMVVSFDVEQVAEGLVLWVQLALIGGTQELERLNGRLHELAAEEAEEAEENRHTGDDDEDRGPAREAWNRVWSAIAAREPGSPLVPAELEGSTVPVSARRRLVIVDEPERHLNPRLQRQAAAWLLKRLVSEAGVPCLAASHSTAFLSLPGPAVFAHVRRVGLNVEVERLAQAGLEDLDEVAQELGFDRGELLATVGCFLLVEGVHDQIVLETIFAQQLRQAGVYIAPLCGSPRRSLLDVDVLWRFTTAPVALALDHIDPELLAAAQAGNAEALRRLRHAAASQESKAAGELLERMAGGAHRLHLLSHPGTDLIDALDDDAVRAAFCDDYPGAAAMQAAWQAHVEAEQQAGRSVGANQRKDWIAQTYGIPNNRDSYKRIAQEHVRIGRRPPALTTIVDAAVELAMRSRTSA